ncbi:FMN-binding negative transcriptional regulator [Comamonas composti]|uniref:FMN-binding negative transcriptional regulator n=1 Tax=Comamonas composti TaxID=408558 RepID=UPI0004217A0C|nr:FMN-binding negative transcriptional regulator [Comamonas composti]
MYLPKHFSVNDSDAIKALMREHPLAMLVTHTARGLDANHLPLELREDASGRLSLAGHVARANPVWQQLADGQQVMAVFRAEQAYVSPNWYPSKQATHRQVPTWNYRVVHAHGRVHVRDNARFVLGVVGRLTKTHEQSVNPDTPWKMADAPADYLQQMLAAIVGIEIEITGLEAKFKLSQNKLQDDRLSAADALQAMGEHGLAQKMRMSPKA